MSKVYDFSAGGYQFLEGGFPYSQAVIAQPGFALRRVRLSRTLPMSEGFAWIRQHLTEQQRPTTALCACELRSPEPFTFDGFKDFNADYVAVLRDWGLSAEGRNPVARSNLAPQYAAPEAPGFYAFTYTVPQQDSSRDWVIAGSGEWPEDQPFPEGIVARGDLSEAGLRKKVAYVLDTMQARVAAINAQWADLSAAQVYTVHDFSATIASDFSQRLMLNAGLQWHLCRPPIREIEFEMDVRSVRQEVWQKV